MCYYCSFSSLLSRGNTKSEKFIVRILITRKVAVNKAPRVDLIFPQIFLKWIQNFSFVSCVKQGVLYDYMREFVWVRESVRSSAFSCLFNFNQTQILCHSHIHNFCLAIKEKLFRRSLKCDEGLRVAKGRPGKGEGNITTHLYTHIPLMFRSTCGIIKHRTNKKSISYFSISFWEKNFHRRGKKWKNNCNLERRVAADTQGLGSTVRRRWVARGRKSFCVSNLNTEKLCHNSSALCQAFLRTIFIAFSPSDETTIDMKAILESYRDAFNAGTCRFSF